MKKLIQAHTSSKSCQSDWKNSPSLNRIENSKKTVLCNSNVNKQKQLKLTDDEKYGQRTEDNYLQITKHQKQHNKMAQVLNDKSNSHQVSGLYAEHIYKSNQKDFFYQAQFQKYRLLLEKERKQKLDLLAEKNEWRNERIRLIQEKQIVKFALDTIHVHTDLQNQPKRSEEIRRQTTEALQNRYQKSNINSPFLNSIISTAQNELGYLKTVPLTQDEEWERIKRIQNLKQSVLIGKNSEVRILLEAHEQVEKKLALAEEREKQSQNEIDGLQKRIHELSIELNQKNTQLSQKEQIVLAIESQLKTSFDKIQKEKDTNLSLQSQIQNLIQEQKVLEGENKRVNLKLFDLEKELQLTQQEQQTREQRERQCIQVLQKFSKELKLSDEKIKEFISQQFSPQSTDIETSKKTYQQHLSYILHLCKKKETLYESLVEDFKQRMKQSDFRASIIERKLNNFIVYQSKLRQFVKINTDKEVVYKAIIRFGH